MFIKSDFVHIDTANNIAVSNKAKGHTSRYLREKFPHLKKLCGKDHLWSSSYYAGTAGSVSSEFIRLYITECQGK